LGRTNKQLTSFTIHPYAAGVPCGPAGKRREKGMEKKNEDRIKRGRKSMDRSTLRVQDGVHFIITFL